MSEKKAIVFDFFDVVHRDPLKQWVEVYGINREEGVDDIAFRLDTGAISYQQYIEELAALNGQTPDEINEEFAAAELNQEMVDLIIKLQESYRTALLSNTNHEEIDPIFERHKLSPIFHEVIISSDTGLAKPDQAIYRLMLDRLGLAPEYVVFIDDNAKNVAAAESVGIDGIVYTSMPDLYNQLADHGISIFAET